MKSLVLPLLVVCALLALPRSVSARGVISITATQTCDESTVTVTFIFNQPLDSDQTLVVAPKNGSGTSATVLAGATSYDWDGLAPGSNYTVNTGEGIDARTYPFITRGDCRPGWVAPEPDFDALPFPLTPILTVTPLITAFK